ncbi:MAG: polyprenol monophosphomannose synthase [Lentisphaeria bacterium]|nr:polyprenol monophosphomannose synthase [Lentisphaeria bacterium]
MISVSVILPTFREKDSIPPMLRSLDALHLPGLVEIIVADDHSPDGTGAAALETAKTMRTPVRVEQNPGVRGLAPSVVHGFSKAQGEILVCMDADGQHRPEDLPGLLAEFDRDPALSMAVGSRHVPGGGFTEKWNPFRVLCSGGAASAARLVLGVTLKDPMSGFFAIRREAFDRVKSCLSPEGFKIMLELAFLLSLTGRDRVAEHPITFAMRKHGESKLSGRVAVQYLAMLMRFVRTKKSIRGRLASARP